MMKQLYFLTCILLTPTADAECPTEEIAAQLQESGLYNRPFDEESWHVGDSSNLLYMRLDPEEGDIVWTGVVERKTQAGIAWINDKNLKWRYAQVAIDQDLDLIASFAVPHWQEGCPPDAIENSEFFLHVLGELKSSLQAYEVSAPDSQSGIERSIMSHAAEQETRL
ncbi:hypothetical protein [Luminiphilus syltensis]|uniref:hypothetical protein n=1 Tax=Luminiphilus syltensis TaxID=1341119 RepID=UPI000590EF44|nr:hypothetical protein [Luminiphilus syltensis]